MEGKEYYKVIGDKEEQKEAAHQDLQEALDTKSQNLAEHELEKTNEEVETINTTQKIVDEIIGEYGGDVKPIPLDHIYVLESVNKATKGRKEGGVHQPLGLNIGVNREGSPMLFASHIAHELFHAKSIKSVRVDKDGRIHLYRSGLSMIDRKDDTQKLGEEKEYFGKMEEAIVAECAKIFMDRLQDEEKFKPETEAINKMKDWALQYYRRGGMPEEKLSQIENEIKYIPDAEEKVKEILASYENEKERSAMAAGMLGRLIKDKKLETVERYEERSKFYGLLDNMVEKSNGEYKNRSEIFAEFAKANFTGNYMPLARIVERILGKGEFRKIAEEYSIKPNNMENQPQQFNIENSPIREAYKLLEANNPKELNRLYSAEDQRLMKSNEWDYKNPDLIVNKVKNILESTNENMLTEEEKEWRQEILWFWYHHAISCTIGRYRDRETAKAFSAEALEIQPKDSPNRITKILDLLVNDKLAEAEEFVASIPEEKLDDGTDNPEPQTARDLIEYYKKGMF